MSLIPISVIPDIFFPFRKQSPCHILRLTFDILIDHMFIYLAIEDILALRRTCKTFYVYTLAPIIWKRFLQRLNIPVPPMRPTFRYSYQKTDFEIEQFVTRAVSLDDNWRSQEAPVLRRHYEFDSGHDILHMRLLPGGKYLVASVKDLAGYCYYVVIYSLDHQDGERPLARLPTEGKAYHLQAKYMQYDGRQGIMISFVVRRFKGPKPPGIDPNEYSVKTKIDPPVPFIHYSVCAHMSIDDLDNLDDPYISMYSPAHAQRALNQPPPFREVSFIQSKLPLEAATLFEYKDVPFLALVQGPHRVVIKELKADNDALSTLTCELPVNQDFHPDTEHETVAIRVLPGQNDILLVRKYDNGLAENDPWEYRYEIYAAPARGEHASATATESRAVEGRRRLVDFQISDHAVPSAHTDHPPRDWPPLPLSIFARTEHPAGLVHDTIWPAPVHNLAGTVVGYRYTLGYVSQESVHISTPNVAHVLPGAYRALAYTVPAADRTDSPAILALRRYISPEAYPVGYPVPRREDHDDDSIRRKKRRRLPGSLYMSLNVGKVLAKQLKEDGAADIAWDESIGRVCVASSAGRSVIRVLDFATGIVRPDPRFENYRNALFV